MPSCRRSLTAIVVVSFHLEYLCRDGRRKKNIQEHYGLKIMIFFKIYYLLCFMPSSFSEDLWLKLFFCFFLQREKNSNVQHNHLAEWIYVDFSLIFCVVLSLLKSIDYQFQFIKLSTYTTAKSSQPASLSFEKIDKTFN